MLTPQDDARAAWDGIAVEFVTPQYFDLGENALRRARLRSGMRSLDVAAGSGALSIPAVRASADVLAVDISPVTVDRLRASAREERAALTSAINIAIGRTE